MIFFEIISIFFTAFVDILNAVFSAVFSFLPFYHSISPIIKAFSIDYIICGVLGISVVFAGVIKFIRKNLAKSIKQ